MSTKIDFTGFDVEDVFVALRARARFGRHGGSWTDMYETSRPWVTKSEVDMYIRNKSGNLQYVDRVDGGAVVIKVNFATFPELDSYAYDRFEDNGPGAMKSVRDYLDTIRVTH